MLKLTRVPAEFKGQLIFGTAVLLFCLTVAASALELSIKNPGGAWIYGFFTGIVLSLIVASLRIKNAPEVADSSSDFPSHQDLIQQAIDQHQLELSLTKPWVEDLARAEAALYAATQENIRLHREFCDELGLTRPVDPAEKDYPNARAVAACLRNCQEDLLTEAKFVLWQETEIARLKKKMQTGLKNPLD